MSRKEGISLFDLIGATDLINAIVPDQVRDFLERLAIIEHGTRQSPGAIVHFGKIQAFTDAFDSDNEELDVGIGRLSMPLIHTGLPFQFTVQRKALVDSLEPAPDAWQLDLFLADFVLVVDGLQPAILVEEYGTLPRHLLRDPATESVSIVGSAVLRLQKHPGSSDIDFLFVDKPDPFDATLDSGAVASLDFNPPHFFLGSSEVGLSVRELLFDFSSSYSPPGVLARNQGPGWMGLAIREATVYAPRNLPCIGDLSGGVENLLLGRPAGIQGELEIQFGRTPLEPSTFQFIQLPGGDSRKANTDGTFPRVTFEGLANPFIYIDFQAGFTAPPPADNAPLPDGATRGWTALWTWPGEEQPVEGLASTGRIHHNSVLKVQPIEIITSPGVDGSEGEEQRFPRPPFTFRFEAAGKPPTIKMKSDNNSLVHVVQLNGTVDAIEAVRLNADSNAPPGNDQFEWSIEVNNEVVESSRKTGGAYKPELTHIIENLSEAESDNEDENTDKNTQLIFIVLRQQVDGEDADRVARLHLVINDKNPLFIGTEDGIFSTDTTDAAIDGIGKTRLVVGPPPWKSTSYLNKRFKLSSFHQEGKFIGGRFGYSGKLLTDEIAEVEIRDTQPLPEGDDATSQGPKPTNTHVQILMKYAEDGVLKWGDKKPATVNSTKDEDNLHEQLLRWAARFPDEEFLVVGRTDDLNYGDTVKDMEPVPENIELAKSRAAKGKSLLTTSMGGLSAIDASRVTAVGEHTANSNLGALAANLPEHHKPDDDWLIYTENDTTNWIMKRLSSVDYEEDRVRYRRADIYVVLEEVEDSPEPPTEQPEPGEPRYCLIPAPNLDKTAVPPSKPATDYRVKLHFAWDSPTVTRWADAVPTLAEAEFAWTPKELELPRIEGEKVLKEPADPSAGETLTVHAQWVHDVRTGFTRTTMGLRSDGDPDGLITTEQKNLTAALAFGPMLLSGVDSDSDTIESAARVSALVAAGMFASADLGSGKPFVGKGSKATLISIEAEAQTRALNDAAEDYQVKLTGDYVCTLHIDGGVLGMKTTNDRPMKVRYKNVGVEFDNTQSEWDKIGLAFDTSSMEIEDPGQWEIDGVLGSLLRIVEVSLGRGSLWFEGRIAVALNIGVVEISEAIIRLTFKDGSSLPQFELRGFVLKADVKEIFEGEGRLRIENGGAIRAGIDANILPLKLSASAALALIPQTEPEPYTHLTLAIGVQYSTPIPLLSTGAALYGMKGMMVVNGERALSAGYNGDPIGQELDWWRKSPEMKYKPVPGQHALGVGVVVGTLPDASFCFSASGMVVVAFPSTEVILGVDVKVLEVPDTTVKDKNEAEGTITGLIVIDDEAVKIAVSARYEIPKILKFDMPFGAYFPFSGNGAFVRLGSDGQTAHGRPGEPVTLTLFPGTLNSQARAYLLIEQDGLHSLGGDEEFSFDGFSVGFGAAWGIDWRAGPIRLSASAQVLVGFGTNPLLIKGRVSVAGELDLVVLSISARGSLTLSYLSRPGHSPELYLEGEFCGEVDMFFFSLKGCVDVHIGKDPASLSPPAPEPPVASVVLTDRRDRTMGAATVKESSIKARPIFDLDANGNNKGAPPEHNQTVWPDTAPVLHFKHYIANALPDEAQFAPGNLPGYPIWFGSNKLKYTYRLDSLQLRRKRDNLVVGEGAKLLSTWMNPTHRQSGSSPGNPEPSEHEGPKLKLLDWRPWNWMLNMPDGGSNSNGDPVKEIDDLCKPVTEPKHACVFGYAAKGLGWQVVKIRQEPLSEPPYPSRFSLTGEPIIQSSVMNASRRELQLLMSLVGAQIIPGQISGLPFAVDVAGVAISRGYRLPRAQRIFDNSQITTALPWVAQFDRQLARPRVTLMVCEIPAPVKPEPEAKRCIDFNALRASGKNVHLSLDGFKINARNFDTPFIMSDRVDATRLRASRDAIADLTFAGPGIVIHPDSPCRRIAMGVMKMSKADILVIGYNKDGQEVLRQTITGPASRPSRHQVDASDDLVTVIFTCDDGEGVLFEFCALTGPDPSEPVCHEFKNIPAQREPTTKLSFSGGVVLPIKPGDGLWGVDKTGQRVLPPIRGRRAAHSIALGLPASGLLIELNKHCSSVVLKVATLGSRPIGVLALDENGEQIDKAVTRRNSRQPEHRLTLTAKAGTAIRRIKVGGSEGVLISLCYQIKTSKTDAASANPLWAKIVSEQPDAPIASFINGQAPEGKNLPVVKGTNKDNTTRLWRSQVLKADTIKDRHCQVISYEPAGEEIWNGFEIHSWPGYQVTLLSACGVDQVMVDRHAADSERRKHLLSDLADQMVSARKQALFLEPGEQYVLDLGWSWQAWQSNDAEGQAKSEPPATPPSDQWKPGTPQTFYFAIASEQPTGNSPQDGLNEYQFDVRDISRHLQRVEPADGRSCHFTDDPVWVHFDAAHMEQLAQRYGRELIIKVYRTDPAPQPHPVSNDSTRVAIEKTLATNLEPLTPTGSAWIAGPDSLAHIGVQRINEAVLASPCLQNKGPVMGGGSLQTHFALEPDAMYDLKLVAPKVDANGHQSDPRTIVATRFVTSRYANPKALLADLGYGIDSASPYPPDDIILPEGVQLPSGPSEVSDNELEELLRIMEADTLPLPSRKPASYVVWQRAGTRWRIEGLLIDSLESLFRETAVKKDGRSAIVTRCNVQTATIGGTSLRLHRSNTSHTRVFLKAQTPITFTDDGGRTELILELQTDTEVLTGKRMLGHRPAIIDREEL